MGGTRFVTMRYKWWCGGGGGGGRGGGGVGGGGGGINSEFGCYVIIEWPR